MNVPFFRVGDTHTICFEFSQEKVRAFARLCGDTNPIHIDPEYAAGTRFGKPIVHGMFAASLISAVIGQHMPGHGSIYIAQSLKFLAPIFVDDHVSVCCTITKITKRNRAKMTTVVSHLVDSTALIEGVAEVLLPRPS